MTNHPGSRFFLVALCACALLSAAALLPAPQALNVGSAKGRAGGEWTVLAPVSYKNLTIFPVRARARRRRIGRGHAGIARQVLQPRRGRAPEAARRRAGQEGADGGLERGAEE